MSRTINIILGFLVGLLCLWGLQNRPTVDVGAVDEAAPIVPPQGNSTQTPLSAQPAPRLPSSQPRPELEDYLKSVDSSAAWALHRSEEGLYTGIMGGKIPLPRGQDSLPDVLQTFVPYLIGHTADLRPSADPVRGPVAVTQTYIQRASGYPIYGAAIRLSYLFDESAVVELSSDLRTIEAVDTEIKISKETALKIATEKYQHRSIVRLESHPEAWVYGRNPRDNQMVWKMSLTILRPTRISRELLISARDGRVLVDRSTLRR